MSQPTIPGWRLEAEIGRGADATVWRARSADGGPAVALKVIPLVRLRDPAAHLRESWAAGSTGSRFVVAVQDAGQHDDVAWLAMELASGDAAALAQRCGGRLKPSTAVRIARDVARGLQALADHGFVHRDVKPSNILLRPDGSAMIGDLAPMRGGHTATRSADMVGTPAYLSPEQVRGAMPDARSDVHALGATLFALITGRPPFAADQTLDLLRAIAEQQAPDLRTIVPEVPAAVAEVVATALAKDPALRQQRPAQLAADLDEALAGRAPSRAAASAVRSAVPPPPSVSGPPVWLPLAAGCAAALLGLALGAQLAAPSAAQVEAEAARAEAAAIAVRQHQDAGSASEAELQRRLDALRLERDRLLMVRHAQAVTAAAAPPTVATVAPAPAAIAAAPAPVATPAPAPSPTPVVTVVQPPAPIVAPAVVPAVTPPTVGAPPAGPDQPEPTATIKRATIRAVIGAGTLKGISVHPRNPDELLLWDERQHLWRSPDCGRSWEVLDQPATMASGWAASTAWWAGQSGFIPAGDDRLGWITSDSGRTWRRLPAPRAPFPSDPAVLRACTQRVMLADGSLLLGVITGSERQRECVLYASADAGRTWQTASRFPGEELQLAVVGGRPFMLVRRSNDWSTSLDLGRTWQRADTIQANTRDWCVDHGRFYIDVWPGLAIFDPASGVWSKQRLPRTQSMIGAFALDPRDGAQVYAIDRRLGLVRSNDQGQSWRQCVMQASGTEGALAVAGSRRPRLLAAIGKELIVLDLAAPGEDLFPEASAVPDSLVRYCELAGMSSYQSGVAACPTRVDELVVWSASGVWRSRDAGTSWDQVVHVDGARSLQVASLSMAPARKLSVLAMRYDGAPGAVLTDDGKSTAIRGLDANLLRAGPVITEAGLLVAATTRGDTDFKSIRVLTSRDGANWKEDGRLQVTGLQEPDLHLVPVTGGLVVVSVQNDDICASIDGGRTSIAAKVPLVGRRLATACFVDGTRLWTADADWSVLCCFDAKTRRWRTQELRGLSDGLVAPAWRGLVVDPTDSARLWLAADSGRLVHSQDGGRTWSAFGQPWRMGMQACMDLVRGPIPRLAVMGDEKLMLLDASPAGSALFNRPLNAAP